MQRRLALASLTVTAVLVAACTGAEPPDPPDPAERLAAAKRALDEAASIDFRLGTDDLPEDVPGVVEAAGVGTHAPAFRGTFVVQAGVLPADAEVDVVSVGGNVYADLPFVGVQEVDPADYGAPDPAQLMDRRSGLSSLLTEATGVEVMGRTRAGDQVLTELSATVPGRAVAAIFPSADPEGRFPATFSLSDDDELRAATLTGPFYPDAGPVTYDVTLEASDQPVRISPP